MEPHLVRGGVWRERQNICCSTDPWIHWLILVCALTRDQTHNLCLWGQCPNPLSSPVRACLSSLLNTRFPSYYFTLKNINFRSFNNYYFSNYHVLGLGEWHVQSWQKPACDREDRHLTPRTVWRGFRKMCVEGPEPWTVGWNSSQRSWPLSWVGLEGRLPLRERRKRWRRPSPSPALSKVALCKPFRRDRSSKYAKSQAILLPICVEAFLQMF